MDKQIEWNPTINFTRHISRLVETALEYYPYVDLPTAMLALAMNHATPENTRILRGAFPEVWLHLVTEPEVST